MDVNIIIAMNGRTNRNNLPYVKWSDNLIFIVSSENSKMPDKSQTSQSVALSGINISNVCFALRASNMHCSTGFSRCEELISTFLYKIPNNIKPIVFVAKFAHICTSHDG